MKSVDLFKTTVIKSHYENHSIFYVFENDKENATKLVQAPHINNAQWTFNFIKVTKKIVKTHKKSVHKA